MFPSISVVFVVVAAAVSCHFEGTCACFDTVYFIKLNNSNEIGKFEFTESQYHFNFIILFKSLVNQKWTVFMRWIGQAKYI